MVTSSVSKSEVAADSIATKGFDSVEANEQLLIYRLSPTDRPNPNLASPGRKCDDLGRKYNTDMLTSRAKHAIDTKTVVPHSGQKQSRSRPNSNERLWIANVHYRTIVDLLSFATHRTRPNLNLAVSRKGTHNLRSKDSRYDRFFDSEGCLLEECHQIYIRDKKNSHSRPIATKGVDSGLKSLQNDRYSAVCDLSDPAPLSKPKLLSRGRNAYWKQRVGYARQDENIGKEQTNITRRWYWWR
jgi:hypothetical protein